MEEEITKNCWCQFANTRDGEQVRRRVARFFTGYCGFIFCVHCQYCARHHHRVASKLDDDDVHSIDSAQNSIFHQS